MASSSRSTMAPGGFGATVTAGGVASNLSIAEQLMQLDQAITLTLQDIDANLSAAHQTVTAKILPAVKRYGVASARTWQGAKFWMKFFEAAADVSLSGTSSGLRGDHDDDDQGVDETESDLLHEGEDISQSGYADDYDEDEDELESPAAARAPRSDMIPKKQNETPTKPSTSSRPRAAKDWSDDEDLDDDDEGDSLPPLLGMSPPRTLQFSVPQSRYLNTPAKEAARLMVDDVLRTIDGSIGPHGMGGSRLQEDSDSQSDTDSDDDVLLGPNAIPAYPATASKSSWTIGSAQASSGGSHTTGSRQGRSIEDDTLFGVRAPPASSNAGMQNPFARPPSAASRGNGSGGPSAPTYQPIESTIHGGRSLIGVDRSDTYSAPSPTPFGHGASSSKR
ncbi:hypothetical protein CF327_g6720 [Tilletia walkeri]|uniref:DASH complex subunit ASK1 n=1 Tax=Tilletia walkeri TaxID=117179 RepID=A0A8X7NCS9_9BASI|nr:hypothetical protein CF327_g6720 [Tilletia walkeri]KAE8271372.1 hypothetical protein A4X09_0g982 [Tilletia walkeri]